MKKLMVLGVVVLAVLALVSAAFAEEENDIAKRHEERMGKIMAGTQYNKSRQTGVAASGISLPPDVPKPVYVGPDSPMTYIYLIDIGDGRAVNLFSSQPFQSDLTWSIGPGFELKPIPGPVEPIDDPREPEPVGPIGPITGYGWIIDLGDGRALTLISTQPFAGDLTYTIGPGINSYGPVKYRDPGPGEPVELNMPQPRKPATPLKPVEEFYTPPLVEELNAPQPIKYVGPEVPFMYTPPLVEELNTPQPVKPVRPEVPFMKVLTEPGEWDVARMRYVPPESMTIHVRPDVPNLPEEPVIVKGPLVIKELPDVTLGDNELADRKGVEEIVQGRAGDKRFVDEMAQAKKDLPLKRKE